MRHAIVAGLDRQRGEPAVIQSLSPLRVGPYMTGEKRREHRYPFSARVAIGARREQAVAQTANVSFSGVLLWMDSPPPERQLVRMTFTLPPENDELALTGMVVRIREGEPRRVGIRFYAATPEAQKRWGRFVHHAANQGRARAKLSESAPTQPPGAPEPAGRGSLPPPSPPASAPELQALPPPAPGSVQRADPRYRATVRLRLQSPGDLIDLYTRNISSGGAFLLTTLTPEEGAPLRLRVVHPETSETFSLEAVVRWRKGLPMPGIGVEFVQMSQERRREFLEFIRPQIEDVEAIYVAPESPQPGEVAAAPDRTEG
jgi:uncharacterized protein (TIGR02266 family)